MLLYKHTLVLVFKPQFIKVQSNNLIHNLQIKMNNNKSNLVIRILRAFQNMNLMVKRHGRFSLSEK